MEHVGGEEEVLRSHHLRTGESRSRSGQRALEQMWPESCPALGPSVRSFLSPPPSASVWQHVALARWLSVAEAVLEDWWLEAEGRQRSQQPGH